MINNLQILRAFAAISVVLFHIIDTALTYSQGTSALNFLAGWGAFGVDLFFVISGFVMFHSQLQHRTTPMVFFKKRLVRIVPIYWAITLFVVIVYLVLPAIFRGLEISLSWALSSLAFVSWWWVGSQPVLYVGWTLEWEMAFYLLFAVSLWGKTIRVQLSLLFLGIISLALFSNHFIIIEFLFGIFAAYVYHYHKPSPGVGALLLLLGSMLLLMTLQSQFRMLMMDLGIQRVMHWGAPSSLLVLGVSIIEQSHRRWFGYLGDASYSIYLIQMLSIPAFYKFTSLVLPAANTDALALACLLVTIMAGCISFTLIEKPLTRLLQAKIV